jgi:hypothetical protein
MDPGIARALEGIVQSGAKSLKYGLPERAMHPRNDEFQGVAGWCPSQLNFARSAASGAGQIERLGYFLVLQTASTQAALAMSLKIYEIVLFRNLLLPFIFSKGVRR